MLKHVVMWALKAEAEGADAAENARKMKALLEALPAQIPQLKGLEVGLDIGINAMDVVLLTQFEDREALAVYAAHPAHQEVVGFIKAVAAERYCVDYEA